MRESRTYGSVRGAHSNMRPYRDRESIAGMIESESPVARDTRAAPELQPAGFGDTVKVTVESC